MINIKKLLAFTMMLYTACLISSDEGLACKARRQARRLAAREMALAAQVAATATGAGAGAFAGGGTGAASEAVSDSATSRTPFTIHLLVTSMDMNRYKNKREKDLGCAERITDPFTGKTPFTGETTLDDMQAFIDRIQTLAITAAYKATTDVEPETIHLRRLAKVRDPKLFIPYFYFHKDREFFSISGKADGSRIQTSGVRPEGYLGTKTHGEIVGAVYVREILP